jgi:hypothetical protein
MTKNILIWKTKDSNLEITNLETLLNLLIDIKLNDIDKEINTNKEQLVEWLEQNFPKELDLIASLKSMQSEFTSQQLRELLVRKLRKIT